RTRMDMTHPHRIPTSPAVRRLRRSLAAALVILPTTAVIADAQQGPLDGLAAYVEQGMRDWNAPGLALAVVKDDSVVFARGFGTRTLGRDEPVDEHTSFAIASTTKAFTATALAMLVDEGKVRWDDPVSRHVPGFSVAADPGLSGELTVRDLLSHRTGLPTADVLWYASGSTSDDILRRMRFVRPFATPRSRYMYNNNAYMLAGMVVENASGMPWAEFVRTRILQPLGMTETLTGFGGLDARGNVAAPHVEVRDTVRPIPYRDFDNIGPAGSMNSSVHDMARWIRVQLAGGVRPDGERLVSEMQQREMQAPQFVIPQSQFYPAARLAKPNFTAYGLGWFMQDYRGRKLLMHTGSIDGMSALLALVPEERLGFVIYLNLDHAELRHAMMYRVIDAYLGAPPRDWSTEMRALYAPMEEQQRARQREAESKRVAGTRPSLALDAYAGSFADPDSLAPVLTVRAEGERLTASVGAGATGALEHWHYDVFRVRWADLALGEDFVIYTIDAQGRAQWARMGGTILTRVPEPAGAASTPAAGAGK
ncbi:MAG TPA: serine hydrolase, partial [Longimicrobium sp.]|nr:serine hydrolase [Longimicrobium sp.]